MSPLAAARDFRQQAGVIAVAADEVDLGGIDDQHRRRVELEEEPRIGLDQSLEIAALDRLLVLDAAARDALIAMARATGGDRSSADSGPWSGTPSERQGPWG